VKAAGDLVDGAEVVVGKRVPAGAPNRDGSSSMNERFGGFTLEPGQGRPGPQALNQRTFG
jgi:hypothetical protein